MLLRVTLPRWTIQPSAGSWSPHPAPLPLSTRALRLLLWPTRSPSPSHSKEREPRGMERERGERTAAGRSSDLDAIQERWVQLTKMMSLIIWWMQSGYWHWSCFFVFHQACYVLHYLSQDTFGVPLSIGAEQRVTYHTTGIEASRLYAKKTIVVGNVSKCVIELSKRLPQSSFWFSVL